MTNFLPLVSVLFAVIATAVPWGLPADATFALPLVVVLMVFCWRVIPGTALPPAAAVGLGLLTDLMSGGPLGYWALMCLVASTIGMPEGSMRESRDILINFFVWVAMVLTLGVLGWLLASLFYIRWIDWWPIAFGSFTSIALYPDVVYGLLWIRYGRLGIAQGRIFRTGV